MKTGCENMLTRSDNFSEKEYSRAFSEIIRQVQKVIINKDSAVIKTLMAILAGGHILIEDIPGVGKTTMALAFSRALNLNLKKSSIIFLMLFQIIWNRQKKEL